MQAKFITTGLVVLSLLLAGEANARVYKWVDSNGKVQFSDKPPRDAGAKAEEIRTRGGRARSSARSLGRLQPIKAEGETRPVKLAKVDTRENDAVFERTSVAMDNGTHPGNSVNVALAASRAEAFASSARDLLTDKTFVRLLSTGGTPSQPRLATPRRDVGPINLELRYCDRSGSFLDQVDVLKKGAVTVRSGSGYGSGFIVDATGFILTNAHVIGNSTAVTVKLGEADFSVSVVRVHEKRDAALLRLDDGPEALEPLALASGQAKTGTSVYVVGTPLSESLNHTVTRGIISAERKMNDGQRYYQTDAGVNPGNSGGPVFNESGEVVAIAVGGLFTRSGGSLNINFLIPIEEVLGALTVF